MFEVRGVFFFSYACTHVFGHTKKKNYSEIDQENFFCSRRTFAPGGYFLHPGGCFLHQEDDFYSSERVKLKREA